MITVAGLAAITSGAAWLLVECMDLRDEARERGALAWPRDYTRRFFRYFTG